MNEDEFRRGIKPMKILIAIPTSRSWAPMFGLSLCGLVDRFHVEQIRYTLDVLIGSSLLPAARSRSIETALREGFTHVLMLDDDMIFSADAVMSLINTMKAQSLPFIAANYIGKGANGRMVAQHEGKRVSSLGKSGHEEISDIGLGCALLDVSVMKDLAKPWFEVGWRDETGDYLGEDYYFCRFLAYHGHKVYVDHTASQNVGHMGDFMWKEGVVISQGLSER